jgi:catechol 2,3-dioxygenase-like lactoylglutathione lyase family enzyme
MTRLCPILKCRGIARAERFYTEAFGATRIFAWEGGPEGGDPGYRSLGVLGAEIHLSSFAGDGAFGTAVYLYAELLAPVLDRLRTAAPDAIEYGPVDQPWGMREVHLRDPDNNAIRIGQRLA